MAEKDKKREVETWIALVTTVAVCGLALGFAFVPAFGQTASWFGDRGWLEVLPPIGTFAAASVAAWLAWKNFQFGQQKEISERFQRGVEMIEEGSDAKRNAGIIILEDLALDAPGSRHDAWVREFLVASVDNWSSDQRKTMPKDRAAAADYERTDQPTMRALAAIAALPVLPERPKSVRYLYLAHVAVVDRQLSHITCVSGVMVDLNVTRCGATGSTWRVRTAGELDFDDTDLSHGRFHAILNSTGTIVFSECDLTDATIFAPRTTEVRFERCQIDGTTFSGRAALEFEDCWYSQRSPSIKGTAIAFSDGSTGIFRSDGRVHRTTTRGLGIFEPEAGEDEVNLEAFVSSPVARRIRRTLRLDPSEDSPTSAEAGAVGPEE